MGQREEPGSLLYQGSGQKRKYLDRISLVLNFYPALSGRVGKVIDSLWHILHVSDDLRVVFVDKPMLAFTRLGE